MDLWTIPRHWKRLVETIWKPTIGRQMFIILNPLTANALSSGSEVNTETAGPGMASDTMNPREVTAVAQITVSLYTSLTLVYFLAPKLYPAIGCIPWLNPILTIMNRNEILFTIPYAPIARSPPYLSSCWLISIVTMQEAEFIRKGPIPIVRESMATFMSSLKSFSLAGRCRKLFWSKKNLRV